MDSTSKNSTMRKPPIKDPVSAMFVTSRSEDAGTDGKGEIAYGIVRKVLPSDIHSAVRVGPVFASTSVAADTSAGSVYYRSRLIPRRGTISKLADSSASTVLGATVVENRKRKRCGVDRACCIGRVNDGIWTKDVPREKGTRRPSIEVDVGSRRTPAVGCRRKHPLLRRR